MSPWKVILATLVIFCSGLVTGVVLFQNIARIHKNPPRHSSNLPNAPTNSPGSIWHVQQKEFLRRIDKQLDLTPAQREQIEKTLRESQERTKTIRDKIAPELREEMKRTRDDIRAQLTLEQQVKFDEAMKQLPKSRKDGKDGKDEKGDKGEERRRKESRKEETSAEKPQ